MAEGKNNPAEQTEKNPEIKAGVESGLRKEADKLLSSQTQRNQKPDALNKQLNDLTICTDPQVEYYAGEGVTGEIKAGQHTTKQGETIESIARKHLGPQASDENISKYKKEIETVNGLKGELEVGQKIALPGHTSDGGFVIEETDGRKSTTWSNGVQRFEAQGGKLGYVQRPTGCGGYTAEHWGPNDVDNYKITRTKEGKYLLAEKDQKTPIDKTNANPPDVRVERFKLMDQAEKKFAEGKLSESEYSRFRQNIQTFSERADRAGLGDQRIANTLRNVGRLLEPQEPYNKTLLTETQRVKVAEQVLSHAADPTTVDQGWNDTCNVSAIEARGYARTPDAVSDLVASVALTGKWKSNGRPPVNVDISHSVAPDQAAKAFDINKGVGDFSRSHAGQLAQLALVNAHYRSNKFFRDYSYRLGNCGPDGDPQRTGESLCVDNKLIADHPKLTAHDLPNIIHHLTGESGKNTVLAHKDDFGRRDSAAQHYETEQDLHNQLAKLKKNGQLPAIIAVDVSKQPFLGDVKASHPEANLTGVAGHVVNITDYDPVTRRVAIDNTWGKARDRVSPTRQITVKQLFGASLSSEWVPINTDRAIGR